MEIYSIRNEVVESIEEAMKSLFAMLNLLDCKKCSYDDINIILGAASILNNAKDNLLVFSYGTKEHDREYESE